MKTLWKSVRITVAFLHILFRVLYPCIVDIRTICRAE